MSVIIYEKTDGIATIKFNRPDALNALNLELIAAITKSLEMANKDKWVKIIILAGAGRAFAAGYDLKLAKEEIEQVQSGQYTPLEMVEERTELLQQLTRLIRYSDKVVIAATHGYTVGAGFELAVACDLVIAAEDTKFGFPELTAAMNITGGVTKLLPYIVGLMKAREMAFVGDFIDAQEAYRIGLVNKVVPVGQEEQAAKEMARKIMNNAPIVVLMHKRLLNQCPWVDLETALNMEKQAMLACSASEDIMEAARAFSEKRKPVFKGR